MTASPSDRVFSFGAAAIVFCIGLMVGGILAFVGSPARDASSDDLQTRLLICTVLDELGADTADPRIVNACPVP